MSESLRDLVVSLSLNSDNFTRNIKSIQRQLQEAQSAFVLAGAGVENFENTAAGLAAKLSTLERTLTLQSSAVEQYERALTQASDKLQECYTRQQEYAQRLSDAKDRQAELQAEVTAADSAYQRYKATLGETDAATIAAKGNLELAREELRLQTEEVQKLEGQNVALQKSTQNAADAFSAAQTKLNSAKAAVQTTTGEIAKCSQDLALAQTQWSNAGLAIQKSDQAVASLGRQMQNAESRYRLAAAGIKDFDQSAEGLYARLTLLNEKLGPQEQAVREYERQLAAAGKQLEAAQSVSDPEKIRQASDAVQDAETKLNNARAAVKQTKADIESCTAALMTARSSWTAAGRSLVEFSQRCEIVSRTLNRVGRVLTTVVTTPIVMLGAKAIKASMEFESSFTSVRKTVDATESEFSMLTATSKRMSTEIAASTTEINEVMATGGQLGIEVKYLEDFTRVMIDLGNSCEDLDAKDAATSIAKFANVMHTDQSLFSNIGSTIVDLGNNFATTERPIMEMAQRLAGAGKQVGLTEAQVLGFAAALSSVGIEAQMGGSAFSKALIRMEVACANGGNSLKDFARVSGMTAKQFKALFESDPAAAFQAFIVGLAQLDDEGESAIAVLDEIGISEVRLRDTMLRAVNATDLFSSAQARATAAWDQNTALSVEANKRYATTESKLTNLKNKAMLFAQTIGDDLNPTIQKLIGGASDMVSKLLDMDESQRGQLIRWAAIAASAGPVLLAFSKITKGVGVISGSLGKFATSVGTAGGGFRGFLSVLGSSPSFWFAVTAAVMAGTIALLDYTSGAKKAREAMEGMSRTASNWKDNVAETFYGSSKGLSFFNMSEDDFRSGNMTGTKWLSGVYAAWTDGKWKKNDVITYWQDSFKELTETTRDELSNMKDIADASGYTGVADQLQADMDALDSMDAEVTKLLKKRQYGKLTDAEKIRLQELIDTREAIIIKYRLAPDEAEDFDTIINKVDAEIARAQAKGKTDAPVSVYENAIVALGEGISVVNSELDAAYDKEYALIMLMEDEAERDAAIADLNSRYLEKRKLAALEYGEALSKVIPPVWNRQEIQEADEQMGLLFTKLREYSLASEEDKPQILADLNELTGSMNEGALTEYLSMLMQIQSLMDSGLTEAEIQALFPDIDFTGMLEQFSGLTSYLELIRTTLPDLYSMFNESLPEEVLKIATDLDMTGAQARWNEFAADPGAITTDAVIASYDSSSAAFLQQPVVAAFINKYTEVPEGASTAELTPSGLLAYVKTYAEATTGVDVSGLKPTDIKAMVSGYEEMASVVDTSTLHPDWITAYIMEYMEKEGVDTSNLTPEAVTAFVLAYEEVRGGASEAALTPDNVTAMVAKYMEKEGVDIANLSTGQIEAVVTSFAEATGCDKSELMTSFTVYVTEYREAEGVTPPKPKTRVLITGYDYLTYKEFADNNPKLKLEVPVRLGELEPGAYEDFKREGKTRYWENGVEVPVSLVPDEKITADTIAVPGSDGTLHIMITPEITGSEEAVEEMRELVAEVDQLGATGAGQVIGIVPKTIMDSISYVMGRIDRYNDPDFLDFAWITGSDNWFDQLKRSVESEFTPEKIAGLSAYVSEMTAAIMNGEEIGDEDRQYLQEMIDFVTALDALGIGGNVSAGIAEGMTKAGWDSSADTVANDLESALDQSFGISSPSTRMMPLGGYVSAGIGEGMTNYSMDSAADTVEGNTETALLSRFGSGNFAGIGIMAMAGLASGIRAGQAMVVNAMRDAANQAIYVAKNTLRISSPSKVFRDEIGVMTMKGLGEGVIQESRNQAKIVQNAARYLTGEAKAGSITTTTNDNRKTYNNQSTISFAGSSFYLNDRQDIRSLAIEIAGLTRRQQRGKGLKMA